MLRLFGGEKLGWLRTPFIILLIYKSLIHPYLTYGLAAWGQAYKTHREKLEADGILDRFLKENSPEIIDSQVSTHKDSGKDSDEDYEPPVKKKTTECLAKSG